jgi:hypothetical protein
MVDRRFWMAAAARSVLRANDKHDFFRLYFLTNDLADLEQILSDADYPDDVAFVY